VFVARGLGGVNHLAVDQDFEGVVRLLRYGASLNAHLAGRWTHGIAGKMPIDGEVEERGSGNEGPAGADALDPGAVREGNVSAYVVSGAVHVWIESHFVRAG